MASLSSKRKIAVNRRLQRPADARAKQAQKPAAAGAAAKAVPKGSAPAFDESVYSQLKSRFESAVARECDAGDDVRQVMRVLVQQEFDNGGRDAALKLQPYIVKYVGDYREQLRKAAR